MSKKWRLIIEDKSDGYYNMAVDEAIFSNYDILKLPTLRIYGWDKPFVSIGYNQKAGAVVKSSASVPFVRRITGGGSIYHDDELTYSLTCSLADLSLPRKVKESYEIICRFLIEFYLNLGLEAQFAKDLVSNNNKLRCFSDFCFSSCEYYDLLIEGRKIGGNAQRRKKDIIFQHGSIPLRINIEKVKGVIREEKLIDDNFTFLDKLFTSNTDFKELRLLLAQSFKKTFDIEFVEDRVSEREEETVGLLVKTKYSQSAWNNNEFKNEKTCLVE